MIRVAFDTNVLVYAELEPDTDKGDLAGSVIERASIGHVIIAAQVVGEFLAVVRRKRRELYPGACALVMELMSLVEIAETDATVMRNAIDLAQRHRLQFWDAVICAASRRAGATHLLTEDMQDGVVLDGLKLIDPFVPSNHAVIDGLLPTRP